VTTSVFQLRIRPRGSAWRKGLHLTDALLLFRRLGVDVPSLSAKEFTLAYLRLAKRYHPDQGNPKSHELMANINAARTEILRAHAIRR
jgi:DnaJ-class molecular chaperone